MIKKLGFIVVLLGLLVFLQPNLFKNVFSSNDTASVINEDDIKGGATRGDGEITQYAEGYNKDDFGDVFDAPSDGQFPVQAEEKPVGPWEDLLELKFAIRFDEEVDDVIFQPKFTKKIRAYENKIIEVEGFIIPYKVAADAMANLEDDGTKFMFSAFPMASCFFCGGAGAESVMEATPKKPIPYTERKIKIRGKLVFNETDFLQLPYILTDVVMIDGNL